jgi:hypothetical protein
VLFLFIAMNREAFKSRSIELYQAFHRDDGIVARLISAIKNDSVSDESLSLFLRGFGGIYGLSEVFQLWLEEQVLSLSSHSAPTSSFDDSQQPPSFSFIPQSPVSDRPPSRSEVESDAIMTMLRQTMFVKPKKAKKRLAPTKEGEDTSLPSETGPISASSSNLSLHAELPAANQVAETVVKVDSDGLSDEYGVNLVDLTLEECSGLSEAAALYAALILHLYIPFSVGIPFLSKLMGVSVVNCSKLPINSNALLLSQEHLKFFTVKAMEYASPVLGYFGPTVVAEVASSDAFFRSAPEASFGLRALSDELYSSAGTAFGGPLGRPDHSDRDAFIRPFHSDTDDRNQYKTQVCFYGQKYISARLILPLG